jgi:hypothetical protein
METTMIEFSLSIDLGKKEGVDSSTLSMPVDRDFIVEALLAVAAGLKARTDGHGAIRDEKGTEVGSWKFGLLSYSD